MKRWGGSSHKDHGHMQALDSRAEPAPAPAGPDAVEEIYRTHADAVARWVRYLASPTLDVEDLVHEIFLVVQRQLPGFRGDARVSTWLYRITQNVVTTARRKERGRRFIWARREAELGEALVGTSAAPGERLERQQDARDLYRALDLLPDKYRSVLVLFEMEALSGEEIATMCDLRPETVRVRLHRARKLFLKALASLGITRDGL